ncbi:MAG TPA: TonB-dependent receptor plug domain-containing protein, partial [Bacteroidales bacterium]|nr:TonB-dependent receptor plug domain-containing protein [Bacteroidales bacterium]
MKKKWIVINPSPHWKFLLVMKTMFLFFLLTTFTAFSEISYSQVTRISLNLQNVPVKEVLKTIEDQTEFIFFYQDQEIDLNRIVSITVMNLPVNEILDRIFAGTENFYTVRDRQIIIARNKNKLAGEASSIRPIFPQSHQGTAVTGKVTDGTSGEALPGVNIVVEGSTIGTITNTEGWYQITVPSPSSVLIFSYVGYTPHREKVNNRTQIDVVLEPSVEQLDEVVTVGYGVQKKINLSGAVDVVTSKNIEDRPVNNVVQALQGLAPNLNVLVGNEGGEVGGKMILNVRGIGSINGAGGSPYILVDGIEQSIYNINPNDIESISVLKDAAASAIYGARAAFGVILVTTKKGKSDGVTVNYSNNYSYSTPLHLPKMVNSIQFAEYLNLAAANDGAQPIFQPIIIDQMKKYQAGEIKDWTMPVPWAPNYWLEYTGGWANTDWFKIDYKEWVPKSSHNFSLSGGDKRIQFFLSGATFSQE